MKNKRRMIASALQQLQPKFFCRKSDEKHLESFSTKTAAYSLFFKNKTIKMTPFISTYLFIDNCSNYIFLQ
jgi:hypothetical protein